MEFTPAAQKQVDALPKTVRLRLERWPHVSGAKPLRGALAGRFRVRTGDYRIQFYMQGEIVVIEKLGHRDGFYEE